MTTPEVDSLWIDNDPRLSMTRYVLVTSLPDGRDKVQCLSWYDVAGGTRDARPSKSSVKRFQPLANGFWSKTGFRPAEAGPALGYPHGYGPDAEQYTGSGDA
jgi:hypothetical protein